MANNLQSLAQWATIVHDMSTIQLKVTLPRPLHELLKIQANKFGLTLSSYIKSLIIEDIKNPKAANFPEYQASEMVEKSYQEAMKNQDKSIRVDDIDKFDDLGEHDEIYQK